VVDLMHKPFRVLGLTINEDLTVNVQLFEHQDNFYTFNEKNHNTNNSRYNIT
jgi:hypothetical protein